MAAALAQTLFGTSDKGEEFFIEFNGTCFRYNFLRSPPEPQRKTEPAAELQRDVESEPQSDAIGITSIETNTNSIANTTVSIDVSLHDEDDEKIPLLLSNTPRVSDHNHVPSPSMWGNMSTASSDRHIPGCLVIQPYGARYPEVHMFTISSIGDDQHTAMMRFVNPHATMDTIESEETVTRLECVCHELKDSPGVWRVDAPWDIMMNCFTPNNGFDHFGMWVHLWMTHLVLYISANQVGTLPPTLSDPTETVTETRSQAFMGPGELKFQCRLNLKFINAFITLTESRTCVPFEALYAEELQENNNEDDFDNDNDTGNEEKQQSESQDEDDSLEDGTRRG